MAQVHEVVMGRESREDQVTINAMHKDILGGIRQDSKEAATTLDIRDERATHEFLLM